MKNNKNGQSDEIEMQPVRFKLYHSTVRDVTSTRTCKDRPPDVKPMHPVGDGLWLKETILPAGTYEYCLGADGQCVLTRLDETT